VYRIRLNWLKIFSISLLFISSCREPEEETTSSNNVIGKRMIKMELNDANVNVHLAYKSGLDISKVFFVNNLTGDTIDG